MIIECPECGTKNQTSQPPQSGKIYRCGKCHAEITFLEAIDTEDALAEISQEKPRPKEQKEVNKEQDVQDWKLTMNWFQRHLNWTWVLAYLLWIPLNASESVVAGLVAAVFLLIVSGWVIKQKGRRLWWILLTIVFSPLWLGNKKRKLASSQKLTMPLIQRAKTGTGCFLQIIGGILWLGCGLYIMVWEFSVIADALSTWVAILAFFMFPVLFVFAVPIAWFLTGTFPLIILILWLLTWVGMAIMGAGASMKGEEF